MAIKLEPGELSVRLQYGKDLKDCDWFGEQDPYVILRCGNVKYRSNTHHQGGRNPVWDQVFAFKVDQETEMELDVWDEDVGKADDCIGKGKVELVTVRHAPTKQQEVQVPLVRRLSKRQQGFVYLTLTFLPTTNRTSSPGAATAAASAHPVPYAEAVSGASFAGAAGVGASTVRRPSDGSLTGGGPSFEERSSLPAGIVPAGCAPDLVPRYEPSGGLIQPQTQQPLPCQQGSNHSVTSSASATPAYAPSTAPSAPASAPRAPPEPPAAAGAGAGQAYGSHYPGGPSAQPAASAPSAPTPPLQPYPRLPQTWGHAPPHGAGAYPNSDQAAPSGGAPPPFPQAAPNTYGATGAPPQFPQQPAGHPAPPPAYGSHPPPYGAPPPPPAPPYGAQPPSYGHAPNGAYAGGGAPYGPPPPLPYGSTQYGAPVPPHGAAYPAAAHHPYAPPPAGYPPYPPGY